MKSVLRRRVRDFVLGARLAVGNGRSSIVRLALTAVGIALVTAVLLSVAALSPALEDRNQREHARELVEVLDSASTSSLLAVPGYVDYKGKTVQGLRLDQVGSGAPLPPGVRSIPQPGEIVLSPGLAELLATPEGALLRPRFPERVVGTITPAGLTGPGELYFYVGEKLKRSAATPVGEFGVNRQEHIKIDIALLMLIATAAAAGLVPLIVFVVTSARVASVSRERRLAAIRLVGADAAQLRRIAVGESLVGALAGVTAGLGLFLLTRPIIEHLNFYEYSFFASSWTPSLGYAAFVMIAVLIVAVGAVLFAFRRTVIEPLGVVRRARGVRRKLVWRLALLGVGVVLATLGPQQAVSPEEVVTGAGVALVLLAVPMLLPWLLERIVSAIRGGSPAVLLAVRRLQLDSTTASRVAGGVAVVLAGAITVEVLLSSVRTDYSDSEVDRSPTTVAVEVPGTVKPEDLAATLDEIPGARLTGIRNDLFTFPGPNDLPAAEITVAPCATLQTLARLSSCNDGDVFIATPPGEQSPTSPGAQISIYTGQPLDGSPRSSPSTDSWTVPASARQVEVNSYEPEEFLAQTPFDTGVLVTPGAISPELIAGGKVLASLRMENSMPEVEEHIANAIAVFGREAYSYSNAVDSEDWVFQTIERSILGGSGIVLLIAMASLLVSTVDSLAERRRSLAVMAAAGTSRRTLAGSLFVQSALPLLAGVLVALGVGIGLAALLLSSLEGSGAPMRLEWDVLGALVGGTLLIALLTTASTFPMLRRAMSPEALRAE